MKLVELLEVLSEDAKVEIWRDRDDLFLGRHDGKDSIDSKYNECDVVKVYHTREQLDVVIGGVIW